MCVQDVVIVTTIFGVFHVCLYLAATLMLMKHKKELDRRYNKGGEGNGHMGVNRCVTPFRVYLLYLVSCHHACLDGTKQ